MSDDEFIFYDDEWEDSVDPSVVEAAEKELRRRCAETKINITDTEGFDEDSSALELSFPCGRDSRSITLFDYDDIKKILDVEFEKYSFITGYNAICSHADNEIEALVRPIGPYTPRTIQRRIFGNKFSDEQLRDEQFGLEIHPESVGNGPTISLGPASQALRAIIRGPARRMLSFKLTGTGVSQHDLASNLLEKYSNSIFFQLELLSGVSVGLFRHRRYPKPAGARKKTISIDDLQYPKNEYDDAPISLYWYGTSAVGMPLLQYLAFYQVIEFYFPTYYQAEARRKVRSILKSPTFRSDRDSDLGKILSAIQIGRGGTLGDERSQLRATIAECVDADSLREFVANPDNRRSFFTSKTKGLTEHKLPIANESIDLRNDIADRIYDIRCKIVHTKSDAKNGEVELLLPFSKESEQLHYDIELVQYIAQQVLISASTAI